MYPGDLFEKYDSGGKVPAKNRITIRILTAEEKDDVDTILIEGKPEALEFLSEILKVQAKYKDDCGFQMGPKSAGSGFFTSKSTHNLYIHRLPCMDKSTKK